MSRAIKYLSFKTGQIRHIGRKRGCVRYSINILKYKFWSLINTRNIWKYLTLDQQKKFLDGSLQVRFLNLGILTMTNRTRPLLALNILFPKQVPCLLCVSNHLITVNQSVDVHYNQELSLKTPQQISCTLSTFGSGGGDKETTALCLLPLNVMQVGRFHGYYLRLPMTYDNHPSNPIPSILI